MKIETTVKTMKELRELVAVLADEAVFTFGPAGLGIVTKDTAHVGLVSIGLAKEAFAQYDDAVPVGVDMDMLKSFLDHLDDDAPFGILQTEDMKGRIQLRSKTRTLDVKPADTSGLPDAKLPRVTFDRVVTVPTAELRCALEAIKPFHDHATLAVRVDELRVLSVSRNNEDELPSIQTTIPILDAACPDKGEAKSAFPLDYLYNMVRAIRSENVTVELGKDKPVSFKFTFAGGRGSCLFMLAPRIETQ